MDAPQLEEQFWDNLEVEEEDGCWLWIGSKTPDGYGRFRVQGVDTLAGRYAYQKYIGEIPDKHRLFRKCEVRLCVNPEHMHPKTSFQQMEGSNSPAAQNSRRKACIHGHPFEGDNVRIDSQGRRRCVTCRKRIDANKRARFKGPRLPKPGKATLRKEMKTTTFVALGEHYGVTDATIRKWARGFGLKD